AKISPYHHQRRDGPPARRRGFVDYDAAVAFGSSGTLRLALYPHGHRHGPSARVVAYRLRIDRGGVPAAGSPAANANCWAGGFPVAKPPRAPVGNPAGYFSRGD